jgi:hypothetical protein
MAQKRHEYEQSGFKVTDRRLFTSEGELREEAPQEPEASKPAPVPAVQQEAAPTQVAPPPEVAPPPTEVGETVPEMPPMPTAAEQQAQVDAYQKISKELDSQVELSGHSAKEFEMTFERFLASLYMTAMMQLGLMRQQNEQPRIDIIGARQSIDTLTLISEKTKGNLTPVEENFLQNSLYEVRMAYVEVTNALARPPQPGPAGTGTRGR